MNYKFLNILLLISVFFFKSYAQNAITGNLSQLKNKSVRLFGFSGFISYPIDTT